MRPAPLVWNAAGDGVLDAALTTLAEWLLRNKRAVIQELRADPYNQEAGYFVRGYLNVTSRRARRTRNPIRITVDWDRVNGAWRDRGDSWIGNRIPTGGLWMINMVNSPGTAQSLVRPVIRWIWAVFPDAEVNVASWLEGGQPAWRVERRPG